MIKRTFIIARNIDENKICIQHTEEEQIPGLLLLVSLRLGSIMHILSKNNPNLVNSLKVDQKCLHIISAVNEGGSKCLQLG